MRIDVVTIFPNFFSQYFSEGVISKAIKKNLITLNIHNLRNFTKDKHKTVDDRPFGGGVGMILKPEPIFEAIDFIKKNNEQTPYIIYLSPQGKLLNQEKLKEISTKKWLILICGRYEGIDERVISIVNEEISIGDYVLTGGELPALVLIDGVCRLIKGVVKEEDSLKQDSFYNGRFLDFPQYTRPRNFRGMKVPEILLTGNHKKINIWRLKEAIRNTLKKRPDLFKKIQLTPLEKKIYDEIKNERE